MTPDAAVWFQRTPDGPWYRIGSSTAHDIKLCQGCGQEALIARGRGFCSPSCYQTSRRRDSYKGRHHRVNAARGSAKLHACVGCGQPAAEWSQTHGTTGLDPSHYEPRCVLCHRQYDIGNRPRGEAHTSAKLTDAQARGIKASVYARHGDQAEHARVLGVSKTTLGDIRSGRKRAAR